jgi:hypothetical protein
MTTVNSTCKHTCVGVAKSEEPGVDAVTDEVITIQAGMKQTTISKSDLTLITGKLRMAFDYVYMGSKSLPSVLLGERPCDVPEDWVIDHKNRNKLDNTRENLRWVSRSFNAWNAVRKDSAKMTSRFRGVTLVINKNGAKWRACALNKVTIGHFDTEREAAIASAKEYVRTYGVLAETSDILFSADQSVPGALLSLHELVEIKRAIAENPTPYIPNTKTTGVYKVRQKWEVVFRHDRLGIFETHDAAVAFRAKHVASVRDGERKAHFACIPTKDPDGHVAIKLSGVSGAGCWSKVDREYWHELTFKRSWCLNGQGYVMGSKLSLHKAVMLLMDPAYVSGRDASVDHINPTDKLDNRACNLRVATNLEQQRNKCKRLHHSQH